MLEALGQVAHSSQSTLNATNAAEASPQVSFSDVTETPEENAQRRFAGGSRAERGHPPGFDGYTSG